MLLTFLDEGEPDDDNQDLPQFWSCAHDMAFTPGLHSLLPDETACQKLRRQVSSQSRYSSSDCCCLETGYYAGMKWSSNAHWDELTRIASLVEYLLDQPVYDVDWYFGPRRDSAFLTSEHVGSAILHGHESKVDRKGARDFWESIGIWDIPSAPWLKGFCMGAIKHLEVTRC